MALLLRTFGLATALAAVVCIAGQAQEPAPPAVGEETAPAAQSSAVDELALKQTQLADRYKRMEDLLFKMAEVETGSNPKRAALLKQAFNQSKERLVKLQMEKAADFLTQKRASDALGREEEVQKELGSLLDLLLTEVRPERLKDEMARIKEYIKEAQLLKRLQQDARGRTEGGADPNKIAGEQGKIADRAGELAKQIQENEEAQKPPGEEGEKTEGEEGEDQENPDEKQEGEKSKPGEGQNNPGENPNPKSPGEGQEPGEKQPGEKQPGEKQPGDMPPKEPGEGQKKPPTEGEQPKPSEGEPSEPSESQPGEPSEQQPGEKSKPSKSKPQKSQPGQPGQPPQPGEQEPQDQEEQQNQEQPQDEGNPARKRIQAAEEKMRQAKQKLEEAKRKEAVAEQREAEQKLREAIAALEEILRQMREEEIERTLRMLEGRFAQMLEMQLAVYEKTRTLNNFAKEIPDDDKDRFDREVGLPAGRLSSDERRILVEADKALLLLEEEGSSIAFPETVEQMRDDMDQVVNRLAAAKADKLTLGVEEDIIAALQDMIEALQKAQQDMQDQKQQQQQQQQANPEDQPLVDKLAELKMIRALQDRVRKRTVRYAGLLDNEEDPVGQAADDELRTAIQKLGARQQSIFRVTRDIVLGKNE